MSLNEEQMEALASSIVDKLHSTRTSSNVMHEQEHEYIRTLIADSAARNARRERIKERIAGSFILTGSLTLVGAIGAAATDWFNTHFK